MSAPSAPQPADVPPKAAAPPAAWWKWSLILALGAGLAVWRPGAGAPGVTPDGWKLLAIFLPCILALMLNPIPGGAAVLIAVVLTILTGALPLAKALGGYADPSVWMVLGAFLMARALIKTGLARRIALQFIRVLGHTTLGLSYAVVATETVFAAVIPTVGARVGAIILPIMRSLAELYDSHPGETAARLGRFLMLSLYQGSVIACAIFLTGQASNPLAAQQARQLTEHLPGGPVMLGYREWLVAACVPGFVSLLLAPWLVFRWEKPQITRTPEAAAFAKRELEKQGPLAPGEWLLTAVLLAVGASCVILPADLSAVPILAGLGFLLLARTLSWDDIINERAAWDVFIWYGGLLQLGKQLKDSGLPGLFAQSVAGQFDGWPWLPLFVALLLVNFFAHYAFASITSHMVSLYPAFVAVLIAAGAPPMLTACAFAFFTNFSAGLTHYGTTPGPIVFSAGYIPQPNWWRVGFCVALVNISIWLVVGMGWWKVLGLW
ncbi:MAG: DASS family sodium-coupled anion symporter [Verrucomicrobia bacterium]|nr:DASS family sodium-coupled anion symporter [Verrucomicrobiota bacterium]